MIAYLFLIGVMVSVLEFGRSCDQTPVVSNPTMKLVVAASSLST